MGSTNYEIITERIAPKHGVYIAGQYPQKEGAPMDAQLTAHLDGSGPAVSVFPSERTDTQTRLAMLDFDNKEKYPKRLSDEQLYDKMHAVATECFEWHLRPLVTVSRSGTGYDL